MQFSVAALPLATRDAPEERKPNYIHSRLLAAVGVAASNPLKDVVSNEKLAFQLDDGRQRSKGEVEPPALPVGVVKDHLNNQWLEMFKDIDTHNRGRINRDDLRSFAARNGMPADYVESFVAAVQASSGAKSRSGDVSYEAFRTYVSSRECALWRAFQLFDLDGDGRITAQELERSLAHVRVKCPTSRCVYQSRRQCVLDLLARVDLDGNKTVEFNEFRRFFMMLPKQGMAVDYWISADCGGRCDVGGCVLVHDAKRKGSPWGHLFAGAMAGAASRTATAPLETLRLSAMTGALPMQQNALAAAKAMMERQGWRAMYKGNLTNVIRSAPQKALDFFAFDAFKGLLGGGLGKLSPLQTLTAAGLAGGVSNFLLYPLEVVRSRLTVDSKGLYKGVGHALQRIVRTEGVSALYKGAGPSVAAILPEAAIVYGLFDILKRTYARLSGKEPTVVQSLSFGVFSAFMGQVVAFPLETVSRRMQVCGLMGGSENTNFFGTLNNVVSEGGPIALYRGIGAATLKVVPMAIVSFGTYEVVRHWINELEEKADDIQAQHECNLCGKEVA